MFISVVCLAFSLSCHLSLFIWTKLWLFNSLWKKTNSTIIYCFCNLIIAIFTHDCWISNKIWLGCIVCIVLTLCFWILFSFQTAHIPHLLFELGFFHLLLSALTSTAIWLCVVSQLNVIRLSLSMSGIPNAAGPPSCTTKTYKLFFFHYFHYLYFMHFNFLQFYLLIEVIEFWIYEMVTYCCYCLCLIYMRHLYYCKNYWFLICWYGWSFHISNNMVSFHCINLFIFMFS